MSDTCPSCGSSTELPCYADCPTRLTAENTALKAEVEELKDGIALLQEIVNGDSSEDERLRAENAALKAEVEKLQNFVIFVDRWTNYKPNKPEKPTSYENCVKTIAPMVAEFRAAITQENQNAEG